MADNKWINHLFIPVMIGILLMLQLIVTVFFKIDAFITLNYYHSAGMDLFFTYFTYLGDGLFCCAIIIVLWLSGNKNLSYKMLSGFVISSFVVQIIKNLISAPRPKEILSEHVYCYFINGITHIGHSSFPSGHTTTAFTMAAVFAFASSNKFLKILFFLLAIGVGYSRIYLGQHFVEDVLAGMILGLINAELINYIFQSHTNKWSKKLESFYSHKQ